MVEAEIELEVGAGAAPGEYAVRVIHAAGGGETEGVLRLDLEGMVERRDRLEETVLASAVGARRRVPPGEQPLQQAGQELFEALFGGPVGGTYRASLAVARERGRRLRVVLRLTAPELSLLPWEALYDPEFGTYVSRREPLVRRIPAPFTPEPLPVEPPLRILGLIASPRGLDALDVGLEQEHLDRALAGSIADGGVELVWLTQASWDSVHERLLTERWHVLHFIGHGDYDPESDEGQLALVGEGGRADWVEASRLVDLLDEAEPTPRLVVLNSCSTAVGGVRDVFAGTASSLVRSGIGAVAAMQFSISDRAAVAFPKGFYRALAAGRTVDEAVKSGRLAILGVRGTLEWVTPVLYLRGNATRLFAFTDSPTARTVRQQADAYVDHSAPPRSLTDDGDWAAALEAFFAGRWPDAVHGLELVHQRYPGDARVQRRLDEARRERDLGVWYSEAETAARDNRWAAAITALERIVAVNPTYRDAPKLLEQAQTSHRRQSLIDEMTALHNAGEWQSVLAAGAELARLDPTRPDPGGMIAHARKQVAAADLAARYREALDLLEEQEWQAAVDLFASIQQDQPGYRDTAALLATARQHVQPGEHGRELEFILPDPPSVPSRPRVLQVGERVYGVAFSPDGTRLATASRQRVRVWDPQSGVEVWAAKTGGRTHDVACAVFSPDGRYVATASADKTARVWDARDGSELLAVKHRGAVTGVAFSPDGGRLATASLDKTARVWARDGSEVLVVKQKSLLVDVAFSPDGERLATASLDKTARVWDARDGSELLVVRHRGLVNGVVFSPDGERLATVGDDRTARVWDARDGKELLVVNHEATVSGVMLGSSGVMLGSRGGRPSTLIQLRGWVSGVAFSPDGGRLATASLDKTARVWDAEDGNQLLVVNHEAGVKGVAFSPDGGRLATASLDKSAVIWNVPKMTP